MTLHLQRRQRGISLFVVMVMVLLSTLLVMWGSRTALFNEMVTGNDSDYQRAFEAAQAMVRDAEFDIMGTKSDGITACNVTAGHIGCRAIAGNLFFPQDESDYQDLADALRSQTPSCAAGICIDISGKLPLTPVEFWNDETALTSMKATGATYGLHTGASATQASNPILMGGTVRAWYWVEVLPYNVGAVTDAGPVQTYAPDGGAPYVYRITAVAEGLKPNSRAVVQTVFVRKRVAS